MMSELMPANGCLTRSELDAVIAGQLPKSEIDRISRHIEDCEGCRHIVSRLQGSAEPPVDTNGPPAGEFRSVFTDEPAADASETGASHLKVKETFRSGNPLKDVPSATGQFDELPAKVLGDFRIIRRIAQGGMGVVYEAEQISLNRRVALKVLPFATLLDPRKLKRFKIEAQTAAALHHANIVPVYSVGCDRGVHYYAMQYIEGWTLAALVRERRTQNDTPPGDEEFKHQQKPQAHSESQADLEFELEPFSPEAGSVSGSRWASSTLYSPDVPESVLRFLEKHESAKKGNGRAKSGNGRAVPSTDSKASSPTGAVDTGAVDAGTETLTNGLLKTKDASRGSVRFRTIAQMCIQTAEALEYAHAQGVVHRDIKPSNLMMDQTGNVWVTDFGLALIETDTALTATGDLMGTLRYMSPEQALGGRRGVVDHRTDIYSLGTTLYELLTLRPAFPGTTQHTLLQDIATLEPPLPRTVDRTIPTDLETIVLKAMSKDARERYMSAQALADDLRRFLEHKPIRAKRPGLFERAAKWSRRHTSVVISAILVLILATLGLTAASLLVWRERERTRLALVESEKNLERAQIQQDRADENFRKARNAVNVMLTEVANADLAQLPRVAQLRRSLLEKALAYHKGFLQEKGDDPTVRFETARAYLKIAEIYKMLGRNAGAETEGLNSIALLEDLLANSPNATEYRQALARAYSGVALSIFEYRPARLDESIAFRWKELETRKQLCVDSPNAHDHFRELAVTHIALGNAFKVAHRPAESEVQFRQALAILERLQSNHPEKSVGSELARAHHWLGGLLSKNPDRRMEAERELRAALNIKHHLPADILDTPYEQSQLAHNMAYLGGLLRHTRRANEAESIYRRAIAIREKMADDFPNFSENRRRLSICYSRLGRMLMAQGRFNEAEAPLRQALDVRKKLLAETPDVASHASTIAWYNENLSVLLFEMGRPEESATAFGRLLKYLEKSLAQHPDEPDRLINLAYQLANSPIPQLRETSRAVELAKRAVAHSPQNRVYHTILALASYRSGHAKACIETLNDSKTMKPGDHNIEIGRFFLSAMAHRQLGNKQAALSAFQKGESALQEFNPLDEQILTLRRLRAEAAGLLIVAAAKPAN